MYINMFYLASSGGLDVIMTSKLYITPCLKEKKKDKKRIIINHYEENKLNHKIAI